MVLRYSRAASAGRRGLDVGKAFVSTEFVRLAPLISSFEDHAGGRESFKKTEIKLLPPNKSRFGESSALGGGGARLRTMAFPAGPSFLTLRLNPSAAKHDKPTWDAIWEGRTSHPAWPMRSGELRDA